ncbi:hypothetical protein GCM10007301_43080 [Azorhizobium oxalatiphilum]|uniref:Uncharacterized protein n=1 Tax=Azorhizobium oxalatiphilum TaxID=980631 RepID=A0A917CA26_9HYPH|nr:hypothetical protein GCM10007301_43080 [Azorhizobium oxalatiphilum]
MVAGFTALAGFTAAVVVEDATLELFEAFGAAADGADLPFNVCPAFAAAGAAATARFLGAAREAAGASSSVAGLRVAGADVIFFAISDCLVILLSRRGRRHPVHPPASHAGARIAQNEACARASGEM